MSSARDASESNLVQDGLMNDVCDFFGENQRNACITRSYEIQFTCSRCGETIVFESEAI